MNANNTSEYPSEFWSSSRDRYEERLARWEARQQRRDRWGNDSWWGGAILILLGTFFLLQNLGLPVAGNWWALFLMIPALGSFEAAWHAYRFDGRPAAAKGLLVGGLMFTVLTVMLLLNLNWSLLWPVILVVIGTGLLLSSVLFSGEES